MKSLKTSEGAGIVSASFNRARMRQISSKVTPMPADAVADNIISAGWLLSQMDISGGNRAFNYVGGRAVTVGLEAMEFKAPVYIGDDVSIYTEVIEQGRSSLRINVEAWAASREGGRDRKVTEGVFTFVHIDEQGQSKEIASPPFSGGQLKKDRSRASHTENLDHEPVLLDGQELSLRTVPFPRDKNYNGDIFGGWVLAQMDLAAALRAWKFSGKTAVSVAIDAMTFRRPVSVLNEVSFYTQIERVGTTSVTINVEAWALRRNLTNYEKVTEGSFVYVAVDENRRPVPVQPQM